MYEKWKLKTCDMYVWYIVCLIYTFVHCNEQYPLWECIMHTYLPWETILSRDMHIIRAWPKTYLFWYINYIQVKRQKSTKYVLIYSLSCSCSYNLSSFWFIIKQQWTIENNSIFSNSSHLEWRAGLSDIILKGTHPWTIQTKFDLIWFSGFRREDLNVI